MVPHSSTLARKIPWTEEPGRLQFMGSLRVRHDWATSLSLFIFMHWRRKWQPTPVFLPGESQGRGRLVGCHLWGHTELTLLKRRPANNNSETIIVFWPLFSLPRISSSGNTITFFFAEPFCCDCNGGNSALPRSDHVVQAVQVTPFLR